MERLPKPVLTSRARRYLQWDDSRGRSGPPALLSTVDGQRNVIELESVAKVDGTARLDAGRTARARARQLGNRRRTAQLAARAQARHSAAGRRLRREGPLSRRTACHDVRALALGPAGRTSVTRCDLRGRGSAREGWTPTSAECRSPCDTLMSDRPARSDASIAITDGSEPRSMDGGGARPTGAIGTRWSTNSRADASRGRTAARAHAHARAARSSAGQRGAPQVDVEHAAVRARRRHRAGRRPGRPPPACRRPAPRASRARTCRSGSGTRTSRPRCRCARAPRAAPAEPVHLRIASRRRSSSGPPPTPPCEPGRSSSRNASRFFSRAMRPTYRKTGRGRPRDAAASGWNSVRSMPCDQRRRFAKPCARGCSWVPAEGTMTPETAAWKRAEPHSPSARAMPRRARQELGKARVEGGRERPAPAQAMARAASRAGPRWRCGSRRRAKSSSGCATRRPGRQASSISR